MTSMRKCVSDLMMTWRRCHNLLRIGRPHLDSSSTLSQIFRSFDCTLAFTQPMLWHSGNVSKWLYCVPP